MFKVRNPFQRMLGAVTASAGASAHIPTHATASLMCSLASASTACASARIGAHPHSTTVGPMRYASSAENKDYYQTLGISRNATKDEIKKAYRKRAMATHPDQGGKPEEFQAITEAYEVLSDDQKRATYDRFGSEAAQQAFQGGPHRSAEDIFNEFFGGMGMGMGGMGMGGMGGKVRQKVQDLEVKLELTLEEVYTGTSKSVRVTRPQPCSDCHGHGTKSGEPKPTCTMCHGRGNTISMQNLGHAVVQTMVECSRCGGTGSASRPEDSCGKCHGKGYRNKSDDVTLPLQAGLPSNVALRLPGEGGVIPGAEPADLIVHITQRRHKVFTRRGDDLLMELELTLPEALLGFERPVKMLDGRTVCVTSKGESLQSGSVLRLSGEGMVSPAGGRGDLFVLVNVKMPQILKPEQRKALEDAFGVPPRDPNANAGNRITARVLRESKDAFLAEKEEQWAAQESGGGGFGQRRRATGPRPDCVQQ